MLAAPAEAALKISPVTREVCLPRGASETGTWTVSHDGQGPVLVTISALSYDEYLRGNRSAGISSWLAVLPETMIVSPGAEGSAEYRVRIPEEGPAELMAMVFFAEQPLDGPAMLQGRIGMAFYAMASGSLQPALALVSRRIQSDPAGRLRFTVELRNTGNVHLRPYGCFVVSDAEGRPVTTARLDLGFPVLPGGMERFTSAPTDHVVPPGAYALRWLIETGSVDGRPGPVLDGEEPIRISR